MTEPLADKLKAAEEKRRGIEAALCNPASLSLDDLRNVAGDLQHLGDLMSSISAEVDSFIAASPLEPSRLEPAVLFIGQKDPSSALVAILDCVISLTKATQGRIMIRKKGRAVPLLERGAALASLPKDAAAACRKAASLVMENEECLLDSLPGSENPPSFFSFACLPLPKGLSRRAAVFLESDSIHITRPSMGEASAFLAKLADSVDLASLLQRAIAPPRPFPQIIGNDPAFLKELKVADRVARTNIPLLIEGETGTGKELVARAVHEASGRSSGPFLPVNCSGLPESILDSELFGYEKGAFTGASSAKTGLFEAASGGTLFLDEISDMISLLQAKLLRFIQFGEVRRLGSSSIMHVDVRVIAATNRDLEQLVADGNFRKDLYFRLNVVTVHLPLLRERLPDISLLIDHFLALYSPAGRKLRISRDARSLLMAYDYPGNVRELENIIRRAIALSEGRLIAPDQLPEKLQALQVAEQAIPASNVELKRAKARARRQVAERLEQTLRCGSPPPHQRQHHPGSGAHRRQSFPSPTDGVEIPR